MKIKEFRDKLGLSQKALGDKLGLTPVSILKYEKGLAEPSIDTLKKMSNIFGVSVDTIIENNTEFLDMRMLDDNIKTLVNLVLKLNPANADKVIGYINGLQDKK